MGIMLSIFLRYFIGPSVGLVVSRAGLEVCHYFGWYPENELARLMLGAPTLMQLDVVFWLTLAVGGIVVWASLLFISVFFQRRFPRADLERWRQNNEMKIWQAGCLWGGIEPGYPVPFLNPAYSKFSMLLSAAETGKLDLVLKKPDAELAHSIVSRKSLIDYANKRNIKIPKFLSSNAGDGTSIIKMTVGEDGPYFDTGGDPPDIRRTFNLKLENIDRSRPVSNYSVKILSVTPAPDYEGPWLLEEGQSLAAGDHVFISLVTYGECGDSFMTMGTTDKYPLLDIGEKYTVTIRATAPETAYCDFRCRIWVDDKGQLRIEGV